MPSERMNGTGTKSSSAESDRDGRAGEEHRAAGRRHRPHDRAVDVVVAAELLAEAVDDEQRVVDCEPEPDSSTRFAT